jgi:intergrase/recombinase
VKKLSIDEINLSFVRVKIRVKGDRLYLRATLPAKEGIGKKQYDVSTGLVDNQDGLRVAKARAQRLEADLNLEKFDWSDWIEIADPDKGLTVQEAIARFENWYWETRGKTKGREQAYLDGYQRYFDLLPTATRIDADLLREYLVKFPADSDKRKRAHLAYGAIARFLKIELPSDWKYLKGKYQPASDRYIPKDEEIEKIWQSIANPGWRWVFGILAAYGLRPHEVFFLDLTELPVVRVNKGTKTGERLVYPVPGHWVKEFELTSLAFPKIVTEDKSNQDLGEKISQGFRARRLPVVPYGLRDAYAVRCAVNGIDSSIAAKWMGHDIATHCKHYQKYIDAAAMQKIWERLSIE